MLTKKDNNKRSVANLHELLLSVIKNANPYKANESLIAALRSQSRLARWQDESLEIYPCSLNTHKNAASNVLEGGYANLDQLRINALLAIQESNEADKRGVKLTRVHLISQVVDLKQQVKMLEQVNMHQVNVICELKRICKKFAVEGDATAQERHKKEMSQIDAKLYFTANAELIEKLARHA